MQRVFSWLEAVFAAASLAAGAAGAFPFIADYGHHNYGCPRGQLLPCIINTRADIPAGIPAVWVGLSLLAGFVVLALIHLARRRRLFLFLLFVIAAAYWAVFIVINGGFFVATYQISAVCVLFACLAAISRQAGAQRLRFLPAFLALSSFGGFWFIGGLIAYSAAPGNGLFHAVPSSPPDGEASLFYAEPNAWNASGTFVGFDQFTADELNRVHQGSQLRPLHFVDGDTPSSGLNIVSVNPIDRFTWGAVVLSSSGQCDAVLLVYNAPTAIFRRPYEYFSVLPAANGCFGSAATKATVTGPPIGITLSGGS